MDLFEQQRVQGILITPLGNVLERLETMRSRGIPSVLVDRLARTDQFCSVSVDDVAGGATALSHLLSVGSVRPAFVGGPLRCNRSRTATGVPPMRRNGPGSGFSSSKPPT